MATESSDDATTFERQILTKLYEIQASIESRIQSRAERSQASKPNVPSSSRRKSILTPVPSETGESSPWQSRASSPLSNSSTALESPQSILRRSPGKCPPGMRNPLTASVKAKSHQEILESYVVTKPLPGPSSEGESSSSTTESADNDRRPASTKVQAHTMLAINKLLKLNTAKQNEQFVASQTKAEECYVWPRNLACHSCLKLEAPCVSRVLGNVPRYRRENCIKCSLSHTAWDEAVMQGTRRLRREVVTIDDLRAMHESS